MHTNQLKLLFLLFLFGYTSFKGFGQLPKKFEHNQNIQKVKQSSHTTYLEIYEQYNAYLSSHPMDEVIAIEQCKFIQNAELDEYEENPNQATFDTCLQALKLNFPYHPKVLIYLSDQYWGDSLEVIFDRAKQSLNERPALWPDSLKAEMYFNFSHFNYSNEDYEKALEEMNIAAVLDEDYAGNWLRAQLYIDTENKEKALEVLDQNVDTARWLISRRANQYLELEAYDKALESFMVLKEIDSSYIDNEELSKTFQGIGKYDEARLLLVADTIDAYDPETSRYALFKHDLKYGLRDSAKVSYYAFRDIGWEADPLAISRIALFFAHPFLGWSFRDILGLLLLILAFGLLCLVPLVWILPVYAIGHKRKIISKETMMNTQWGLSACWWIAAGAICATFLCMFSNPEYLNAILSFEDSYDDLSTEEEGLSVLLYTLITGFFVLFACRKIDWSVVGPKEWPWGEAMMKAFLYYIGYRFLLKIYYGLMVNVFGFSADEIYTTTSIFLSNREDIDALVLTYGPIIGLLIVVVIVPIIEEIAFRGIYLDGVKRHLRFRWANFIQAVLFSAAHGSLMLFPVFLVFGLICGYLRKESNGLMTGIFFHVINNLIAMIALINLLPS